MQARARLTSTIVFLLIAVFTIPVAPAQQPKLDNATQATIAGMLKSAPVSYTHLTLPTTPYV